MKLYFIALLPDSALREQIKSLKEEMREKYGVKHALKLPAHITLQIPFKLSEEEEAILIGALSSFATRQNSFMVQLDGFGSFPPRVIFLKVVNHQPVIRLHKELQEVMESFIKPEKNQETLSFHPHITVATRDLDKKTFKEAWPQLKDREFKASFQGKSLALFKHNGKLWEIQQEFFLTEAYRSTSGEYH